MTIGGRSYVLKHLGVEHDWVARASGDLSYRPLVLWRSRLLERLPGCLDDTIVGCAYKRSAPGAAILMRHVTSHLVRPGDSTLPMRQHRTFLDHMTALHATFWGFEDTVGLLPLSTRYLLLSPWVADLEVARGGTHPVPTSLVSEGWRRLAALAPDAHVLVTELLAAPDALVDTSAASPTTFIHGDWKAGNLGTAPDGATILLDWATPGAAPACVDLAHYLVLNAARLPEPKEAAIDAYRRSLERRGVTTSPWWPMQLDLCLLGTFLMFGWEKALGDREELAWWRERVMVAARWLP
ncbi:MAG: phosphotransferase [Actinomycetota bacterium]|nr:phosphotransferase [Actinomycetota bacterium]